MSAGDQEQQYQQQQQQQQRNGNNGDDYIPGYPINPMWARPTAVRASDKVARPFNIQPSWPGLPVIHQWPMVTPYMPPPAEYDYQGECRRAKQMPIEVPRPPIPDHCAINSVNGRPDIRPPMWVANPHVAAVYESKEPFCKLNRLHY